MIFIDFMSFVVIIHSLKPVDCLMEAASVLMSIILLALPVNLYYCILCLYFCFMCFGIGVIFDMGLFLLLFSFLLSEVIPYCFEALLSNFQICM